MLRVDSWTASLFQRVYDLLWDGCCVPIGTFRMFVALTPIVIDASWQAWRGGLQTIVLGSGLYAVALCLLYDPLTMMKDNRLQACGRLASLNTTAQTFARRTRDLRLFYLALLVLTSILFHRTGAFLLIDVTYARGIQIRPRQLRPALARNVALGR